jgi:predicted branched-subunit amino acid permease
MVLEILSNIDPNLIIYGLVFVIFFVFIQLVLSRSLKDKSSASIIALCVALLSVYGLSKTGFDIGGLFNNIGIDDNIIYNVLPFVILAGLIFLLWKVRLRFLLTIAGIGLLIGSFFVYEQTVVRIVGGVLLVIGLILMYKESRRAVNKRIYVK